MDVPTVHCATFVEELGEASDELLMQDFSTIFGDKDEVVEIAVDGVGVPPKYGVWHTLTIPQWAQEDLAQPTA